MPKNCSNDDILRAIGRVEGHISGLKSQIDTHFDRMNRIDNLIMENEERIRNRLHEIEMRTAHLEKKQYAIYAIAGFIAAAISLLTKFFK